MIRVPNQHRQSVNKSVYQPTTLTEFLQFLTPVQNENDDKMKQGTANYKKQITFSDSLKIDGNRFRIQLKMAVWFAVLVSFVQNVNSYKK